MPKITHLAKHVCLGFIEYERTVKGENGAYQKYGYRRRLIDNGIYKRGDCYGTYSIWGSEFHDRALCDAIADEFAKVSVMRKIIHGV